MHTVKYTSARSEFPKNSWTFEFCTNYCTLVRGGGWGDVPRKMLSLMFAGLLRVDACVRPMDQISIKTPNPNCRFFFKIYQ